jgi:RNA polymerase sigma factor (sigma-70 family)
MTDTALAANETAASLSTDASIPAARPALDLNKLFRDHHQHLLRFVQRYVRNREDAEDVVQNTFMEALRCADRFAGLSKPSTWLFGIALNLARNHVRRNCSEMHVELDEAILEQIVDTHADPALIAELREIAGKVEAFLGGLSPDIRATFEAVVDGESTYEQAAEELQVPVGTVRSRVSRVRAAVRSQCN